MRCWFLVQVVTLHYLLLPVFLQPLFSSVELNGMTWPTGNQCLRQGNLRTMSYCQLYLLDQMQWLLDLQQEMYQSLKWERQKQLRCCNIMVRNINSVNNFLLHWCQTTLSKPWFELIVLFNQIYLNFYRLIFMMSVAKLTSSLLACQSSMRNLCLQFGGPRMKRKKFWQVSLFRGSRVDYWILVLDSMASSSTWSWDCNCWDNYRQTKPQHHSVYQWLFVSSFWMAASHFVELSIVGHSRNLKIFIPDNLQHWSADSNCDKDGWSNGKELGMYVKPQYPKPLTFP